MPAVQRRWRRIRPVGTRPKGGPGDDRGHETHRLDYPSPRIAAGALLLAGCASGSTPELGGPLRPASPPAGRHRRGDAGHPDGRPRRADARPVGGRRAGRQQHAATGLLDVLRGRGVADRDLRTSGLSISPTFDTDGRITGYEVTNQVAATLRDVAGAGALIDAAAQAAGDAVRVQQISSASTTTPSHEPRRAPTRAAGRHPGPAARRRRGGRARPDPVDHGGDGGTAAGPGRAHGRRGAGRSRSSRARRTSR